MISPFLSNYAAELSTSNVEMGWFQSSANISNNLMQIVWGNISDATKRRTPFIVIGGVILSLLWIPMIFVTNTPQLIYIVVVQALVGSMTIPTWTALLGDLAPSLRLGRLNASISIWSSLGGIAATLAAGVIMSGIDLTGASLQQVFLAPILIASACGVCSSLVMLRVKETKNREKLNIKRSLTVDILTSLDHARRARLFRKFCAIDATFEFFMSIAWPLLAVTQVKVLNASWWQIALLAIVQTAVTVVFQRWAGRLCDIRGRKPLLVFFRFALVTVPLGYAFAPSMNALILIGVFWGFAQAFGSASATAYLLDAAPEQDRSRFVAIFNLVAGSVTFVGSLLGGYLGDFASGIFGLTVGLQVVYVISTLGRLGGAMLHFTLEESLEK